MATHLASMLMSSQTAWLKTKGASMGLSVLPLDALLVHECGNVVLDMPHVLVDC